ncbi:hemophore-related protein [Mycolicibacter virginiensis]|uniref:Hemophore-related protein n=1 Tax=Mycolicibacter virginiensis TaxID=1795032 RepID=A0A9X7INK1_9MYCO|nr:MULTISPECIES: hemophore-related protein [Mycobacteriaceae]PQM52229.1 hemophore-related protein [Mycolicibacter virginiensis]ULP46619.1 hemophore-related protein [Mycolicibacter virginiensis]
MSGLMRTAAAVGFSALALTGGQVAASADPDTDPVVNTTCSYSQVVSAMNDQSPGDAEQFNATPAARSWLQNFLAAPPERRQQIVDQAQGTPDGAHYVALVGPLANACENYY